MPVAVVAAGMLRRLTFGRTNLAAEHAVLVAALDDPEEPVRRLLAELDDSVEAQVTRLLGEFG